MFQFNFIEGRYAMFGLELRQKRIRFRLCGTGVHHTSCS